LAVTDWRLRGWRLWFLALMTATRLILYVFFRREGPAPQFKDEGNKDKKKTILISSVRGFLKNIAPDQRVCLYKFISANPSFRRAHRKRRPTAARQCRMSCLSPVTAVAFYFNP